MSLPKKKDGRIKYNPDYHDNWAWSLAALGATDEDIAAAFGVSKKTIIRWRQSHPSFKDSVMQGKGVSDAAVIRSLYKRATGFEVIEERQILEKDKDGNTKPLRVEKYKKYVPPDTTAQIFWLKNRQRDRWTSNPQVNEIEQIDWIEEEDEQVGRDESVPRLPEQE